MEKKKLVIKSFLIKFNLFNSANSMWLLIEIMDSLLHVSQHPCAEFSFWLKQSLILHKHLLLSRYSFKKFLSCSERFSDNDLEKPKS